MSIVVPVSSVIGADDRAALADDVADLLRVDLDRDDRRRPLRHLRARRRRSPCSSRRGCAAGLAAPASSATCMISRVMPSILMSICSAVTPSAVPATLKSMSPRWSSSPRMSVSTCELVAFEHQAHRDARDRRLDRHAGVHQREAGAADRRHRARAVRLEDLGHDADHVRERGHVGHHGERRRGAPGCRGRSRGASATPIMPVSPTQNGGKL